jgi:hypothetical protein
MAPMTGLPCMNCGQHVDQSAGKVFAEVFVCPRCYEMAERLYTRCDGELRRMLLLLREAIRIALVEGKLQYGPATPMEDVPKADLLKMIVELTEKKNATAPRHPVR